MASAVGLVRAPFPLPEWFEPWARKRYALKLSPADLEALEKLPNLGLPELAWTWALLEAFGRWHRWRLKGSPKPRPLNVWGHTGAAVPRWAWRLEEAWAAEHPPGTVPKPKPPVPPAPPRRPVAPIMRELAVWVNTNPNAPPGFWKGYAGGAFRNAIYQALDGLDDVAGFAEQVAGCKREGIRPFGWSWIGDPGEDGRKSLPPADPAAHGRRAAQLVAQHGLAGWWFNGEKKCEGGAPDHRGLRISGQVIAAFRDECERLGLGRDVPVGWTPESRLDLDHWYFQAEGVCYAPQAYPFEVAWTTVSAVLDVAFNMFGYKPSGVNVLVQAYVTEGKGRPDPQQYVDQARAAGLRWLILYTADQSLGAPEVWTTVATVAA